MSIWGKIFGSDSVIEAGKSAIDAVWHTDEEKAHAHMKFLELYQPFKLAQRLVACAVVGTYCLGWVATFAASFWLNVDKQLQLLNGDLGSAAMLVVGFYFAGGVVSSLRGK